MNSAIFELGLVVVLVLLNGVFSATEIALVTLRRSRIQQLIDEGNRGAVRVQRLKSNPGRFLAVIQVGINFLGFLASAFAAVSLVDDAAAFFRQLKRISGHHRVLTAAEAMKGNNEGILLVLADL